MDPLFLYTSLCGVQAAYYLLTGVWPLVSIRSFEAVSGKKTDNWTGRDADHWLVNTVAVLILASGVMLAVAAYRGRPTPEVAVLAMACAVALLSIDVVYVTRRVISAVYLLDAVAEVALLAGWATLLYVAQGLPGVAA